MELEEKAPLRRTSHIRLSRISAFAAPIMKCMGTFPLRVNESAKAECGTTNSAVRPRRATKGLLAARYAVGIRTIENWQYAGIIRAGLERGQAVFDVADCDERLLNHKK